MKKPLRCRLGRHQWYIDAALFTSVWRCKRCNKANDLTLDELLTRERLLWEQTRTLDFDSAFTFVLTHLKG